MSNISQHIESAVAQADLAQLHSLSSQAKGHISNKLLAEEFLRKGESITIICFRMGWMEDRRRNSRKKMEHKPEDGRLLRALGLKPESYRGKTTYRTHITDKVALEITRALNLDPIDIGL